MGPSLVTDINWPRDLEQVTHLSETLSLYQLRVRSINLLKSS